MSAYLTPAMCQAIASIGSRSASAFELGINGVALKRLSELGFLKIDLPREKYFPPYYSLTEKGEGAAAILTAKPHPVENERYVARIKRLTCVHYNIPELEMISARRSRCVARPRQVAMYLAKNLTPKSLPEIGRLFGNRDHTTVLHAVRVVTRLIEEDDNFKDTVRTLAEQVVSEEQTQNARFPQLKDTDPPIDAFLENAVSA